MKRLITVAVLAIVLGALLSAQDSERLLKVAMNTELVDGDLKAAIEQYKKVADSANRALAAQALVRMAECYQKLGDSEAQRIYERLVRDFGDRPEATTARARLRPAPSDANAGGATAVVERQQVWMGDEVNFEGLPSSDGRYLAYVDNSQGQRNVAVRDLKTSENRVLAGARGSDNGFPQYPVISPDGQLIAFGWYAYTPGGDSYSINLVRFDGTGMRVLARPSIAAVDGFVWAPDGRRLSVVLINKDRTRQIALLTLADGSVTQLRSFRSNSPSFGGFSPDGRFLTYAAPPDGTAPEDTNSDVFALAVDGSTVTPLVHGPAQDSQPVWTPDGRAVVFVSDRSGKNGLWAVRVSDGKPVGSPVEIRPGIGSIANMGFTRSGTLIYGVSDSARDLYIAAVDPATLSVTSAPRRLSDRSAGSNSTPQWSPDGRSIAFLRGSDRRNQTIVIRSVADGLERTLPTKIVDAVFLMSHGMSWLPDGRALVIRDTHPSQEGQALLRCIDVETGEDSVLLNAGRWDIWPPLQISPDGKTVFYTAFARDPVRNVNRLRLMKRELATGRETELFQRETGFFSFYGLSLSPDGSSIVFLDSIGSGPRTLVTMPVVGGTPVELYAGDDPHPTPTSTVGAWMRAWTPDARYVITKTSDNTVWAYPAGQGRPRKLDWPLPEIGALHPTAGRPSSTCRKKRANSGRSTTCCHAFPRRSSHAVHVAAVALPGNRNRRVGAGSGETAAARSGRFPPNSAGKPTDAREDRARSSVSRSATLAY